jgi:DNA recombination protein RmuC
MDQILYLTLVFSIGALISWFLRSARAAVIMAEAQAQIRSLQDIVAERGNELENLKSSHGRMGESLRTESSLRAAAEQKATRIPQLETRLVEQDRFATLSAAKVAELETRMIEERKASQDKLALLDDAQRKLSDAFKVLSSEALKSNNQSFLELAKTTLEKFQEGARNDLDNRQKAVDELVKPIRESLQKVDGKIGEIEKVRLSAYAELSTQVKGLIETHLPMLRNETANLVKALRQPAARGRWGEIQLRRVVEMAGMVNYCDFLEQESRSTEDGKLRPDLIVKLPGGKQIVVDAKAAVNAYLDATEAKDEETQRLQLANHARQVRDHMVSLGRKGYWEQFDPTPELVVMFLPGEMFFSAALQQDPGLIEFGVNEKVIPATPTTLIALLRAVAYGWRQEALAKNAQEVADLGRQLYERIAKLGEHWSTVGDRLGKAVDAYNNATATLESRVLVSARRLKDLEAGSENIDIPPLDPVERTTRAIQAPEILLPNVDAKNF